MVTFESLLPELVDPNDKSVNPVPGLIPACLSSQPSAPISSSSGCDVVVAVGPEAAAVLLPVAVCDLSTGSGETRPLAEKNVAAALLENDGKLTVIVPCEAVPSKVWVTGAEKSRVRTPVVMLPLVTSASLV